MVSLYLFWISSFDSFILLKCFNYFCFSNSIILFISTSQFQYFIYLYFAIPLFYLFLLHNFFILFISTSQFQYSIYFYFPTDYNQQSSSNQQQPTIIHQGPQIHTSGTQMPQIAPPPLAPIPQQGVPAAAAPILQAPPQFAAPFPQAPPPFLPPAVRPPPFIPQQTPQIINYVQSQPQFPQPPFQGFQQPFNPVVSRTLKSLVIASISLIYICLYFVFSLIKGLV